MLQNAPSTFIKFVIKIFVLSIFEWPFYTGFTVYQDNKFLMGMGLLEYSECADSLESSLLTDAISTGIKCISP